jgi:AcrR family transcriptional regulator
MPTSTPPPERAAARAELLARIVDEVAAAGLADRSLRELAAAVGTSHRMLLYHFGSREGLVAAVVEAVEAAQREALHAVAADADDAPEVVRRLWARVADPALRPFVRLFFEAVAYAGRAGRPVAFTTPWLADAQVAADAVGTTFDPVEVRLGIAVMRGLLVDVVTGDDPDAAAVALERFIEWWEAAGGRRRTRPRARP